MGKFIDIAGQKYGRLTAICLAIKGSRQYKPKWLFRCECGGEITIPANAVRSGNTKSCGCLSFESKSSRSRDALRIAQTNQITHGRTGTRLYQTYKNMKARCYKPQNKSYKYYGGKGITMCDEWLINPQSFIDWALSNGYKDNLTIDRKDSNKNYCPDNCQFITQSEQARRATIVRQNNLMSKINAIT